MDNSSVWLRHALAILNGTDCTAFLIMRRKTAQIRDLINHLTSSFLPATQAAGAIKQWRREWTILSRLSANALSRTQSGCPDGHAGTHWLAAQREILGGSLGDFGRSVPAGLEKVEPPTKLKKIRVTRRPKRAAG
jgi:Protein of unknown function (DUF2934)